MSVKKNCKPAKNGSNMLIMYDDSSVEAQQVSNDKQETYDQDEDDKTKSEKRRKTILMNKEMMHQKKHDKRCRRLYSN